MRASVKVGPKRGAAAARASESLRRIGCDRFIVDAVISRDGEAVIVRLTPDQAMRLVDMIHEMASV